MTDYYNLMLVSREGRKCGIFEQAVTGAWLGRTTLEDKNLVNFKKCLHHDLAILCPNIHPRKTHTQGKTWLKIFNEVLFVIALELNKYPSARNNHSTAFTYNSVYVCSTFFFFEYAACDWAPCSGSSLSSLTLDGQGSPCSTLLNTY